MREILFRAKRLDNGEWVEGDYTSIPCPNVMFYNSENEVDCVEVDPSTLCQFTGRLDAKKNRLWAGDWIEATLPFKGSTLPHKGFIVYNEDLCCYCSRNDAGDTPLMNLNQNTITRLSSIHDKEQ